MDMILMAGLWLESSVWDEVVAELDRLGHRATAVPLPGVDDRSVGATLEDQVSAALSAVDAADSPLVVGHSAASSLAWIVADRRPGEIAGVAMIGGFPAPDGETYAEYFDVVDGVMEFPGWEPFEGPDSDDLDEGSRSRFEAGAIPVAEGVARAEVRLADERRYDVPVTLICPEFSPDDAKGWISEGELPELARVKTISYIDIDTGHWPMISQPAGLARVLDEIANPV